MLRARCVAQLDTAEALRGLVEDFVAPRGLSNGGSWRFPNAQVLDLPHSILSLLFQLSQSPTQCVHSASTPKELRQYRALDRHDPGGADLEGSSADDDASSDSGTEAYDGEGSEGSEGSLSDWSDDDDGEPGSGSPFEPDTAGPAGKAPTAAAYTPWRPKPERSTQVLSARMAEQEMLSGSFGPSSEGGLALAAGDLAASVERHYTTTQAYDAPSQYCTTTEWVLVREVSLMLLGETGDAFQRIGEQDGSGAQTFRMLPVQVVHLSPDALQRLIIPLIATANALLRIRFICSQHCGLQPSGATCATVQAFASAVESVLDESASWLTELERRMLLDNQLSHRATDGSLLRFARNARPLISTVSAVARIIENALPLSWKLAGGGRGDGGVSGSSVFDQPLLPSEMATALLDTLFAATREGDGLGKNLQTAPPAIVAKRSLKIPLAYRLLLETIRPQLMMLGAWVQDGRLYDIHQEFFIRASEAGTDPRAAKFWTKAYNLRRRRRRSSAATDAASAAESSAATARNETCVPLLFKSVASHVLACGKSTIVCSEDGVTERAAAAENPRSADDLYRTCVRDLILKLTDHLSSSGAKAKAAVADGQFTSSMMWESCLSSTIRSRCAEQTNRLATRLIVEHRFEVYLDVLRACFFMGDGHFTSEVCRYCYAKVDQGEPWDDHNLLESLFNDVLQQQQHGGDVALSVVVEVERKPASVDDSARRPGIYALDELFVGFRTPWPISIIIDDECIDRCNRIMRLLLQVKRAKHTLDGLFVRQAMDKSGIAVARTTPSASHEALLFQAELMHFVNNLHYYLMNRVAYGGWSGFKAELQRATELDAMAQAYRRYLIGVHDQCLLSPKARYVMDAILKILDIVLEMGHQQAAGSASNDQHVEGLRNRFRRLHKLLQNVLSTVVSQGSDTSHFADLATRLDYNGWVAPLHARGMPACLHFASSAC